jgi:SAM-dependent methyltransferase
MHSALGDCYRRANLAVEPIPFQDSHFSSVSAFDFIEHVPRLLTHGDKVRFRFVELMSEVFRVLKPGGFFFSHTPAYPSPAAFQDPTHVNIITDATYPKYFCNRGTKRPGASRYGFNGGFILIAQKMYSSHLLTLMRKP